jgi:peptidoglycan hydrolase CwlO-like protein
LEQNELEISPADPLEFPPPIIETLKEEKAKIQDLSSNLQIKLIAQEQALKSAQEKAHTLIQKVASKHNLINYTYDQAALKRLTTPKEVAQFAQRQIQLIKEQTQAQKNSQAVTKTKTPPKQALTTSQKLAIGGGVAAGALVVVGVAAKVISAKNHKRSK